MIYYITCFRQVKNYAYHMKIIVESFLGTHYKCVTGSACTFILPKTLLHISQCTLHYAHLKMTVVCYALIFPKC